MQIKTVFIIIELHNTNKIHRIKKWCKGKHFFRVRERDVSMQNQMVDTVGLG